MNLHPLLFACLALALLGAAIPSTAQSYANHHRQSSAAWVDVDDAAARYLRLVAVDAHGTVIRAYNLDETHTVSLHHLPESVTAVSVLVNELSKHYAIDTEKSVLSTPLSDSVVLRVVVMPLGGTPSSSGGAATGDKLHNPLTAVCTLGALVASWALRHRLLSVLDLPQYKPRTRKVVTMKDR